LKGVNLGGFCESCGAPLEGEFKGASDKYCKYCADDKGNRVSREQAQQGIAGWLKSWQGISDEVSMERAGFYMKAMPAWADD